MNPMAQPFGAPPPAQPARHEMLNVAAILLMVAAALAMAMGLFLLVMQLVGGDGTWALKYVQDEGLRAKMREQLTQSESMSTKAFGAFWALLIIAANAFIIFAGNKMRTGQNYAFSMAAAVLSTIPFCFTYCCCCLSMPAGIFALVVLLKPEVKASFTS